MLRCLLLCSLIGCGARSSLSVDEAAGEGGASRGGGGTGALGGGAGAPVGGEGGAPCIPMTEICNAADDDCDGDIDEGCAANGCADGTREGFVDEVAFPNIAGCSGGFSVPGVLVDLVPTCGQTAGDDSANPTGSGCSAADLCSPGFEVCRTEADFALASPGGCAGVTDASELFFISRQTGTGCGTCAIGTSTDPSCEFCSCAGNCAPTSTIANDLFGCGTAGVPAGGCGLLDRFSDDQCLSLPPPWACAGNSCGEALNVTKPGPTGGGALCCRVLQPPG